MQMWGHACCSRCVPSTPITEPAHSRCTTGAECSRCYLNRPSQNIMDTMAYASCLVHRRGCLWLQCLHNTDKRPRRRFMLQMNLILGKFSRLRGGRRLGSTVEGNVGLWEHQWGSQCTPEGEEGISTKESLRGEGTFSVRGRL